MRLYPSGCCDCEPIHLKSDFQVVFVHGWAPSKQHEVYAAPFGSDCIVVWAADCHLFTDSSSSSSSRLPASEDRGAGPRSSSEDPSARPANQWGPNSFPFPAQVPWLRVGVVGLGLRGARLPCPHPEAPRARTHRSGFPFGSGSPLPPFRNDGSAEEE